VDMSRCLKYYMICFTGPSTSIFFLAMHASIVSLINEEFFTSHNERFS
jgi:hypothetical protein